MDDPQELFPPHLRYSRDEEVIRAESRFAQAFQTVRQEVEGAPHVSPKNLFGKYLAPLMELQVGWFAVQLADILRYAQTNLAAMDEQKSVGDNVLVGLPAEDAELFTGVINDAAALLKRIIDESPSNKGKFLEQLRVEAGKIVPDLIATAEAISDFALDEEGEEDEDGLIDFADDEEGEDEEDEGIIEDDKEESNA